MSRFDYLKDKVDSAEFREFPFRHIYIENFFSATDFDEIINSGEIYLPNAANDEELFKILFDAGYKIIDFPGCITNKRKYIKWHNGLSRNVKHHSACEGFGVVLRMLEAKSDPIRELSEYITGIDFNRALARKFEINFDSCVIDGGIQKYLDGYEISPHPDIRRKALTFMVNVNPNSQSVQLNHHTKYLKFRSDWDFVRLFWSRRHDVERCWVPWDWCEVSYEQRANNSIVIFSPSDDTLHGVKANYNHLDSQRTQLYGNLWYADSEELLPSSWEDFESPSYEERFSHVGRSNRILGMAKRVTPTMVKSLVRRYRDIVGNISGRNY